ncbi:hypothetical protein ACI2KR_28040 [Pseudomonas luteola]
MIESDLPDKPEDIASQQAVYTLRKTKLEVQKLEVEIEKLRLDSQKALLDMRKVSGELKEQPWEIVRKWITVFAVGAAASFAGMTALNKVQEAKHDQQAATAVEKPVSERAGVSNVPGQDRSSTVQK